MAGQTVTKPDDLPNLLFILCVFSFPDLNFNSIPIDHCHDQLCLHRLEVLHCDHLFEAKVQ